MTAKEPNRIADGFEGEVAGLGLSDLVQFSAQNRFSGCIEVVYDGRRGLIFMREGEIVHAEQDGLAGEAAFYEILSWPAGRFSLQEKVASTRSTIKASCQFLVLEAHRLIDERRAARGAGEAPPPAQPPAQKTAVAALLDALRRIPGVAQVVVQGKTGGRVGDDSYEAEVLAGQALYLAMMGTRLAEKLRAGEVHSAAVEGAGRHLLLLMTRSHLVTVLVDAQAQVGSVEAAVRKALSRGA
ncbi:MAG TPA: DUF4388 domain-containing protein [Anaeromyxobacter sp.]